MKPDETAPGAEGSSGRAMDPNTATPPLDRAERERLRGLCEARPHETEIGEYEIECRGCKARVTLEDYGPADDDAIALCNDCAYGVVAKTPALLTALDAAEARVERAEGELARLADLSFDGAECYTVADVRAVLDKAQARDKANADALAALRAEAEGLRARLACGRRFALPPGSAIEIDQHVDGDCYVFDTSEFDRNGDPAQVGETHRSLDAAWAAAEAACKSKEGNANV